MRLISQNGMIDMPYELVTVFRDYKFIYARYIGMQNSDISNYEMASYSTEEKSSKVMELLQMAYAGRFITTANVPDDFNETMKKLMKHGFGTVIVKEDCNSKVEFENLNGYFIFPKDDEVEAQNGEIH